MKTLKFVSIGLLAFVLFGLIAFAQQGQTQKKKVDHMEHSPIHARVCEVVLGMPTGMRSLCDPLCPLAERRPERPPYHLGNLSETVQLSVPPPHRSWHGAGRSLDSYVSHVRRPAASAPRHDEAFPDDEHMKACAEECRNCEKACKAMIEHMASK